MAPLNGTLQTRRPGGSKLAHSSKPVVPAIPLPHVKRQAATAAARASAASLPVVSAASSSPTEKPVAAQSPESKLTNGAATAQTHKDTTAPATASPIPSPASSAAVKSVKEATDQHADSPPKALNGATDVTSHQDTSATEVASVSEKASTSGDQENDPKSQPILGHADQPTSASRVDPRAQASDKHAFADAIGKVNGVTAAGEPRYRPDNQPLPKLHSKSRPPPAVPPSRYQMPPSFQPANRALGPATNGDMHRGPRHPIPSGPPMHQPHPSNGSIHFGTFHGSTSSSPAPLSGGIAPPPGMPIPDGRPPYMGPGANGFPPMMPYGSEQVPVTTFDSYGRPAMAYGHIESFPPFGNNFGPSTPHSYHDSQASGPPDDNSMYNQYPGPARNGVTGPDDSHSPNHLGRMFGGLDPRMMMNTGPPPPLMSPVDDADGLIGHLQQQFGSPEFADCVLELKYPGDRAPPVRIPGHRIVFSRSAELANAMTKKAAQRTRDSPPLLEITLETKSKWIRSDSFYIAVQRLYGMPLFTIPPPPAGLKQGAISDAGSIMERFEFALSYAAAGHLLHWDPVTRRGCEIAMQLLSWQTLERALEFALEQHRDEASHQVFKYGDGSRAILNETVSFIINNLIPNFALDTSVSDPENYSRLPVHPTPPATSSAQASVSPPIARGSSVHLGKGRRSQQIAGIQFGDLSLADGKTSPASDTSMASQQQRSPFASVLSRVLLNVPFATLKMILETASSNKATGWPNAELVYRAVKDAITERERRRLNAVAAVKAGIVPGWEVIWKQLSSPEPRYFGLWTALGWQEEVLPYGPSDSPALSRSWTPLFMEQHNTAQAAYP
ncbi:hypothetical protein CEP51_003404 [Fusarium floridanum]|uniref:Uncharacterized protein n=1 Tax=Fusarium floridanum TaxID=1325733 RepID=A0A428S660_9HYPO|nr:hypothetical protein CEP51_003404 [Fusarium floridanum]